MGELSFDVPGYAEFAERATSANLSPNEKAGFPDVLRRGKTDAILNDIFAKVPAFAGIGTTVLDIGIGCSDLSMAIIESAIEKRQTLVAVDSEEVLNQLPDSPYLIKISGRFTSCLDEISARGPFDGIITYSVIQYVFCEGSIFDFVDQASQLLCASEGAFLIGDVPNSSMRKRFINSPSGEVFHNTFFKDQPRPHARFNTLANGMIDDAVVLGIVARTRAAGYQSFIVPQGADLPMANRREDILIRSP